MMYFISSNYKNTTKWKKYICNVFELLETGEGIIDISELLAIHGEFEYKKGSIEIFGNSWTWFMVLTTYLKNKFPKCEVFDTSVRNQ